LATPNLDQLIRALYAAVLSPDDWAGVLERFRVAMNASLATQHVRRDIACPELVLGANADPDAMRKYLVYYHAFDPWMKNVRKVSAQSVCVTEDFLPEEEFRRSEFYNDFFAPQNFRHFIAAIDEVPPRGVSSMSFMRVRTAPEFGANDKALLNQLLPHFGISIKIARALTEFKTRISVLEDSLNTLGFGVILLAPDNRVVHCNEQAERMLRQYRVLTVQSGCFGLRDSRLNQRLQTLLGAANQQTQALAERRAGAFSFQGSEHETLRLVVAPFLSRANEERREVTAIAFIYVARLGQLDDTFYLQQVFAFTSREAECALKLVQGLSLDEIAAQMALTRNTVKTHLRNLFAKTGTRRQGALIATLSQELAVLRQISLKP
jgi:DNA-binding CsgD family transcriptional regulator